MAINYKLATEIYGANPWLMDEHSLPALTTILDSFRTGMSFEKPSIKYNTSSIVRLENNHKLIHSPYELNSEDNFDAIGIININGAITVNGGESTRGMREVSATMHRMNSDNRIKSFILIGDSGGGSSAAVEIMSDTVKEIRKTKQVIGFIPKGGMSASAMYGIHSSCEFIYSESGMNIVGSCGTMIQFEGKKANSEDPDGTKNIRLYAPASTKKNHGFEEALNNNNYTVLIDQLLKPVNDSFMTLLTSNRPMLKGTDFDDGHTRFSKNSIGLFIDGIKSFSEIVETLSSGKQINTIKTGPINDPEINNKLNNKKMDLNQFKADHPSVYSQAFNLGSESGVLSERDRAGSWMVHVGTDSKAVTEGIKSGETISLTQTQEFMMKSMSLSHLKDLKTDSAEPLKTTPSKGGTSADLENEAFGKEVDDLLDKNSKTK